MDVTPEFRPSFIYRGLIGKFRSALGDLMTLDYLFDWRFGTDTVSRVHVNALDVDDSRKHLGNRYQGSRAVPLARLFRRLKLGADHVLVDLGSGKGRVLIVAAQNGFREVHGVEWSESLCGIAGNNIAAFCQRSGSDVAFEVFHADVADYRIQPSEDVFYLFRPFEDSILEKVLTNIDSSLGSHPRKAWIIYNDILASSRQIIARHAAFRKMLDYRSLRQRFEVYTNQS